VGVVRLALSGIASRMNFSVEDIEDIKISVSEACTNCVQHAYEDREPGLISLSISLFSDKLEVLIEDQGDGFDVSILGTQQQLEKSEKKLGLGLGLTFVKNLMDESEIISNVGQGTKVRMVKYLPSSAA